MRSRVLNSIVYVVFVAVTLFVAVFLGSRSTAAQTGAGASTATRDRVVDNEQLQKLYLALPAAKLPTPRTSDGHPDLSGFYYNLLSATGKRNADGTVIFGFGATRTDITAPPRYPEPTEPSYKPEYAAKVKTIVENQYGSATPEDPNFDCKPSGVPRVSTGPLQIVQTPKLIVILYESNFISETFRLIYMDGRPHLKPEDLEPSYYGDSIGHWEGDTLVVDVIGLNDETWLGGAQGHTEPPAFGETNNHQIVEKYALIHSDQEHVVERYSRHGDMLVYEATVEDPVMFTRPWVVTPRHLILRPSDDRFLETFCQVQSTDKNHLVRPTKDDRFKPEDEHFNPSGDTKK